VKLPAEWLRGNNRLRALAIFRKSYGDASDSLRRMGLLMHLMKLGEPDIGGRLRDDLGKCEPMQAKQLADFRLKPILDIIRRFDPLWVSHWVAERIVDGTLWHDHWIGYVTSIPSEMRESLLKRLETEDIQHSPVERGMSVLAAATDSTTVQRVFAKLCELQQIITIQPEQKHELDWAVGRQLEDLFRLFPPKTAVDGLTDALTGEVDSLRLIVVCRLFSRVGRENTDLRKELSDKLRRTLRAYLIKGVPVMLEQDDFSGSLKADLASALARVGEPEDIAILRELICADIERAKRGREAWVEGNRGKLGNGGVVSYSIWHTRALALLDTDHADTVLLELLNEPEYERDAAMTLVQLARNPAQQSPINPFGQKRDYNEIWNARTKPQVTGFNEERRKRYAGAIRGVLESMLEAGEQGQTPSDFRVKELAKLLAALDARGSADLIIRALQVSGRYNSWQIAEALERLLFGGVTLPAEKTLALFDLVVEQVLPNYYNSSNDQHLLIKALCLLPFVDHPSVGIKKLREAISDLKIGGHELRDVIVALGHSRCSDALGALQEIVANEITATSVGDAWVEALAELDTAEARNILLSLVDPEIKELAFPTTFSRPETVATTLRELARRNAEMEQHLFQLCSLRVPEPKRSLLAKVIAGIGTADAALAALNLFDDEKTPQIPYDTWKQMEDAFVEHKPYGTDTNTYTLAPRSSNEVRLRVFEMSKRDNHRAQAAAALLAQIEMWRLEHGRPIGEPRSVAVECESSEPDSSNSSSTRPY
jgi:hypothetical protein